MSNFATGDVTITGTAGGIKTATVTGSGTTYNVAVTGMEDLTGDVFMRMLDALPRYRMQGLPFRAWLYRIAHNLLVDYFRTMNRQATMPLGVIEEQGTEDDPDRAIEQKLLLERLQMALMRLEPTQCEVVALRSLAGLSLQETALTLGKTEAAIKALQHRGLSGLRRALEPLEESSTS